jgi:hypothetical protein
VTRCLSRYARGSLRARQPTQTFGKCSEVNVFVQQEPRLRARMCGRRSMQQQRVHEYEVTSGGSILYDLERLRIPVMPDS